MPHAPVFVPTTAGGSPGWHAMTGAAPPVPVEVVELAVPALDVAVLEVAPPVPALGSLETPSWLRPPQAAAMRTEAMRVRCSLTDPASPRRETARALATAVWA